MPHALRSRPELTFRQSYFLNAYARLSGSRPTDQGIRCTIPISEIVGYCQLMNITDLEEREELLKYVQAMDNVFMEHQRKQLEAQKPSQK